MLDHSFCHTGIKLGTLVAIRTSVLDRLPLLGGLHSWWEALRRFISDMMYHDRLPRSCLGL